MHKQQGWPQAWEYCQAKPIQTLGRASQGVNWSWSQCIKSHHAQTSSGKGLPSHFWNIVSILPGLRRKRTGLLAQWSKVLFSDESQFSISFGNQGPRVWRKSGEAQNPCCLKSSVKFPQSVMIWAAMSSAGVGIHFLKSTVNAAIYQEISWKLFFLLLRSFMEMLISFFQQDLAPVHTAKGTKSWFNDHGVTVIDWPANSPDLNPKENIWGIVKRKMRHQTQQCRWPEGRYQSNLVFHYTWAVPQADCLHDTPHRCSNSCKRRPNQVLSAYKLTHFSEAWHFCLKYPFFWSYVIFKFSETLNFGFSLSVSHNHQNVKK